MKTQLSTLLTALLLLTSVSLSARQAAPQQGGDTLTFTFAPGADLFILRGNEAELERLSSLIDRHRDAITARRMPLYSLAAVLSPGGQRRRTGRISGSFSKTTNMPPI